MEQLLNACDIDLAAYRPHFLSSLEHNYDEDEQKSKIQNLSLGILPIFIHAFFEYVSVSLLPSCDFLLIIPLQHIGTFKQIARIVYVDLVFIVHIC